MLVNVSGSTARASTAAIRTSVNAIAKIVRIARNKVSRSYHLPTRLRYGASISEQVRRRRARPCAPK